MICPHCSNMQTDGEWCFRCGNELSQAMHDGMVFLDCTSSDNELFGFYFDGELTPNDQAHRDAEGGSGGAQS